jgi:hypothetical protein
MCNMQINYTLIANFIVISKGKQWGRRGRDRLVVGFTTTHVQSAYHYEDVSLNLVASCTRYNTM